jgi:predicted TPR repeat methyltransferase
MSGAVKSARISAERFEEIYRASPDPWNYTSSEYEREKYAATLAAAGPGPYARALEVGCSIGVFTELLAPHCEQLVAMDFSSRALALAAERVGDIDGVELIHGAFPEQAPEGPWDLVVCSEVLYYLDRPALATAVEWLAEELAVGAVVVVVSWRGNGETEPLRGDWVHDLLRTELLGWHALEVSQPGYRLDRFDGHGR